MPHHPANASSLRHIAIIMDGNGRWAKAQGKPRTFGHQKGAEAARNVIQACANHGVPYLTLYAFSAENWNRPQEEVDSLMELLRFYLGREIKTFHKNGIRLQIIGNRERLSSDIAQQIQEAEELTRHNVRLHLTVALSYGSRQEITQAALKLAADIAAGKPADEQALARHLYTHNLPDPDLLIRTGGEQRLSNFLLWQSAYTELYFTNVLWPDFGKDELAAAVQEFHTRERRYGAA